MISLYCFMTLLLCVCTVRERRGWGEVRVKGQRAATTATSRRDVAVKDDEEGAGFPLLMNISKPERHAARNFQHTDCQLNSDSNNPPTITPPTPLPPLCNTLTLPQSFFHFFTHTFFAFAETNVKLSLASPCLESRLPSC